MQGQKEISRREVGAVKKPAGWQGSGPDGPAVPPAGLQVRTCPPAAGSGPALASEPGAAREGALRAGAPRSPTRAGRFVQMLRVGGCSGLATWGRAADGAVGASLHLGGTGAPELMVFSSCLRCQSEGRPDGSAPSPPLTFPTPARTPLVPSPVSPHPRFHLPVVTVAQLGLKS